MMKIWLNMLSKQREDAVDKIIERTRISNIITDFREEAKVNTTNLINKESEYSHFLMVDVDVKISPLQPEYPTRNAI